MTLYRPRKPRVRTVDFTTSKALCLVVDSCCTVLVNSICAEECLVLWRCLVFVSEVVALWRWWHDYECTGLGTSPGRYSRSPRHR